MTQQFWTWSLRVYRRPGVEPLLISLQDAHGLSVNLILWCLWSGARFEPAPDAVIHRAIDLVDAWSGAVTQPLRSARRAVKAHALKEENAQRLRDEIKAAELSAEKIEQTRLETLALAELTPAPDHSGAQARARKMLAAYVGMTDAAKMPGFAVSLPEDLIALIFEPSEPAATALNDGMHGVR